MTGMNQTTLRQLAESLLSGALPPDAFANAVRHICNPPTADGDQPLWDEENEAFGQLPDATVDLDRWDRCGYPEVVYGAGKSLASLIAIVGKLQESQQPVLVTRLDAERGPKLKEQFSQGHYHPVARTFRIDLPGAFAESQRAPVAIVTAGTSDLPVAEEARETVEWMGLQTLMVHDVGVAGPHRLPRHVPQLRKAAAVVVVAGMEGALPSVVGGYVAVPVIAVPTSVGYGAAMGGLAALLGMLNSCAANVTVVNIDAGFKAGYVAAMIARNHVSASKGSSS